MDNAAKRRTGKIDILAIILVMTSIAAVAFTMFSPRTETLRELTEKKKELEEQISSCEKAAADFESKALEIENISANTQEIKNEYFSIASQLEADIKAGKSDKKIAYLTFDDGPYDLTDKFLKVLEKNNVQATFFVRGRPQYKKTIKAQYYQGHTIANHTYTHDYSHMYSSAKRFMWDVNKQDKFLENLGITAEIVRFPGGSATAGSNKKSCIEALHASGYGYVDWGASVGDGTTIKGYNADMAFSLLKKTVGKKKIVVVLMHDYSYPTYKSLDKSIKWLRSEGYILLPLFPQSVKVK